MLSSLFSCLLCSNKIEEIVYYPKENKKRSKKDKNKNKELKDKKDRKIILMKSTHDKRTGLLDGFLEIYNKDGSLKEKVLYIQGKPQYERYKCENGVHTIFFPNSDKIHAKYSTNSENKLDGEYTLYNISGKLIEKRNYKNGILVGDHFYYHIFDGDDLSIEQSENESKPKKKSYMIQYDDHGKVISEKFI